MIKPLHIPSTHGDSFESHALVEVHFEKTAEMTDVRHAAELQFLALQHEAGIRLRCSLLVDGIGVENGRPLYSMRAYLVLPDGQSHVARSCMADLKREDLHLALGEIIEDFRVVLRARLQNRGAASMSSKAVLRPA